MQKLLTRRDTPTAKELLDFLTELSASHDLSTIYVIAPVVPGETEIDGAGLVQNTLTDGSKTFDVVLYATD